MLRWVCYFIWIKSTWVCVSKWICKMDLGQVINSYFDMSQWPEVYEVWTKTRHCSVWWWRLKPTTPAYNSTDINTPLFVYSVSSLNSFHCGKRSPISISKLDGATCFYRHNQIRNLIFCIYLSTPFCSHLNLINASPVRIFIHSLKVWVSLCNLGNVRNTVQAVTWNTVRYQCRCTRAAK